VLTKPNRRKSAGAAEEARENSLEKGLRLLEHVASSDGPVGVAEAARACGLSTTTTHRLLQSLVSAGYISRSGEPSRYFANLKLWTLANAGQRFDIREVARPYLIDLSRSTHEAAHISMLQDDKVVIIDKVEAEQPLQAHSPIGGTGPVHCLATGKAILAYMDEDDVDQAVRTLPAMTNQTITSLSEFKKCLAQVRRDKFAASVSEWYENIVGIAAPILDHRGRPIAAIGIAGPKDRLTRKAIARLGPVVLDAATNISRLLGRGKRLR
jgi:IclR family transcriptional regulator, KDG regulon repressor